VTSAGATHAFEHRPHEHNAPRDCPVCGNQLTMTRLGCSSCGTELSGQFSSCPYCGLEDSQRELLRVFLVSRGNMKELERHLGVSYPTARQRFADLLVSLGFESAPETVRPTREDVLSRLATGELGVDDAAALLADL